MRHPRARRARGPDHRGECAAARHEARRRGRERADLDRGATRSSRSAAFSSCRTSSPTRAASRSRTSSGCRISGGSSGRATRSARGSRTSSATRSTASGSSRSEGHLAPAGRARRRHQRGRRRVEGARHLPVSQVRDAMVPEPGALEAPATAQEAGRALVGPGGARGARDRRTGSSSASSRARRSCRRSSRPGGTRARRRCGEIAEPPLFTLDASMDLDEAFHALEDNDLERVPVVEDGRLRRDPLADGRCSGASPRTSRRRCLSSRCRRPAAPRPLPAPGSSAAASAAPSRMSRSLISSASSAEERHRLARDHRAGDDHWCPLGVECGHVRRSATGTAASRWSCASSASAVSRGRGPVRGRTRPVLVRARRCS